MKLGDLKKQLGEAIEKGDTATARPIVDRLRRRGWSAVGGLRIAPFDYNDLYSFARDARPGLERVAWDAFLREMDDEEST